MRKCTPFLRVEGYSLEPSRPPVAGRRRWSLEDSLSEAMRLPGHCAHVAQPLRPRLLTEVSPWALLALVRERTAEARDPRGRSIRRDAVVAASYVASYPVPWEEVRSSWAAKRRYLRWRKRAIAFLRRELGPDACVVEHRDEGYLHLHAYAPAVLVPGTTAAGEPVLLLDVGPVDPGRRARNEVRRAGGDRAAQSEAAAAAYRDLHHRYARDVGREFGFAVTGAEGAGRRRVDAPTYRAMRDAAEANERLKDRVAELERELLRADRVEVGAAAMARRGEGSAPEPPRGGGGGGNLVARAALGRMGDRAALELLQPDGTVSQLAPGTPGGGRVGRSLLRTVEEARGDEAAIARLAGEVRALRRANEEAEARAAAAEGAAAEAARAAGAASESLLAEIARRDELLAAERERVQQAAGQVGVLRRAVEGLRSALGRLAAAEGLEDLARALEPVAPPAAVLVRSLMARVAQLAGRPTRGELDAAVAERDEAARRASAAEAAARAAEERATAAREAADEALRARARLHEQLREATETVEREAAARSAAEERAERAEEARREAELDAARRPAVSAPQLAEARAGGFALGHAAGERAGRASAEAALRGQLGALGVVAGVEPIADAVRAVEQARAAEATAEERARRAEALAAERAQVEAPGEAHHGGERAGLVAQVREAAAGVERAADALRRQAPNLRALVNSLGAGSGWTQFEAGAAAAAEYQASVGRVPGVGQAARELDAACGGLDQLSRDVQAKARELGGFDASDRAELRQLRHALLGQVAWVPPSEQGRRAPWEVLSEALGPARAPGSSAVLAAATPVSEAEGAAERDHRLRHQTRELYAETARGAARSAPSQAART
ncbi:hypothetical protein J8J14_23720 [Roseomonas sp. SSH11]|uniref:Uncharacterized protein n=1 Tax=Pararoseomonas baculiformis TaxID=2820812 RepID=A0ABS4AMH7_9PROT|nr:hypothetical protein [Pararoseomonas baculiformis]MBP0447760.1 hypothetical protein [Pararoseomonas baculiformis]